VCECVCVYRKFKRGGVLIHLNELLTWKVKSTEDTSADHV